MTVSNGVPGTSQIFDVLEMALFHEKKKEKTPKVKKPKLKED